MFGNALGNAIVSGIRTGKSAPPSAQAQAAAQNPFGLDAMLGKYEGLDFGAVSGAGGRSGAVLPMGAMPAQMSLTERLLVKHGIDLAGGSNTAEDCSPKAKQQMTAIPDETGYQSPEVRAAIRKHEQQANRDAFESRAGNMLSFFGPRYDNGTVNGQQGRGHIPPPDRRGPANSGLPTKERRTPLLNYLTIVAPCPIEGVDTGKSLNDEVYQADCL